MRRGGSVGAALLMATVLGLLGAAPAAAQDQIYQVASCAATASGMNDAWHGTGVGPKLAAPDRFGKRCADAYGLSAYTHGSSSVPYGSYAAQTVAAPEGARIVGFRLTSVSVTTRTGAGGWRAGLTTDRGWIASCSPGQSCGLGGPSYSHDVAPAKRLSISLQCADRGGCRTRTSKGAAASILVRGIVVKLRDTEKPSLVDVGLASVKPVIDKNSWYSGNLSLRQILADTGSGVRTALTVVNGRLDESAPFICQDTRPTPCVPYFDRRFLLRTGGPAWIDGPNDVKVVVVDRAGNSVAKAYSILADNHAPAAPAKVSVSGSGHWQAQNGWFVGWDYPSQGRAAPIVHASLYICYQGNPNACFERRVDGAAPKLSYVTVPVPGAWTARVKIRDAAGNQSDFSPPVNLLFDNSEPGQAQPADRSGWVARSELSHYQQALALKQGATRPQSGIAGYSTSLNGTDPDGTIDVFGEVASQQLAGLHEGFNVFKARAVSGAGVASHLVGQTTIAVDASDPVVVAAGAPDPAVWSHAPVTLTLRARDSLSGMRPAPDGSAVSKGGFLSYQIDGGVAQHVPGDNSGITVAGDGLHTVTLSATDAAGNTSASTMISFRIDTTPAETIMFADQDPNDPQQVTVVVGDRVSGVAGGTIQYRREGDGPWHSLPTTLSGERLSARMDDGTLPAGRYELRALVTDNAGNQTAGERNQHGGYEELDLPLRFRSLIVVAAGVRRCSPDRRRTCRVAYSRPGETTKAAFAAQVSFRAHVTAAGIGLRRVPLAVIERPAAVGAQARRLATVYTDEHGLAHFSSRRRPSRGLVFAYGGDVRRLSARGETHVVVGAPIVFNLPRSAVNGRGVTFRGRLLGGHIPSNGKLLQVQTVLRGVWRTVFTPRTSGTGRWSMKYRFATVTEGSALFRFRVVVPSEPSYPFSRGLSVLRKIRVRARP